MRIAIAGGTGLVGRHVADALHSRGHDPIVVARQTGVDLVSGAGLRDALAGADAVIDTTSTNTTDAGEATLFFTAATRNLVEAGHDAGVGHHVVLSIVGIDRVENNGHYIGKRNQEAEALAGSVPVSVVRATQLFEFAEQVVSWTRNGDEAMVPPLLVQPVAVADVATYLAEVAVGEPRGRVPELAGPQRHDFVDMTRRILTARGERLALVPVWQFGPFDVDMAGDVLLPGSDAAIAPTDLQTWLADTGATAPRSET